MTMSVKEKSFEECEEFVLTLFLSAFSCKTTKETTCTVCKRVVESLYLNRITI